MLDTTRDDRRRSFLGATHKRLCRQIRNLGDRVGAHDREDLLDLIRDISAPSNLLPILREIMSNAALTQQIAARSYCHVSHFDKIVLVDAEIPNGYRLTLHLWDPPYTEAELADELIHDHRFSFWSAILVGELQSRNFYPSDTGDDFRRYQYTPENQAAENFYAFQGCGRLRASPVIHETAGNAYFLPYDQTHKVILPRRDMVCTLVLRSPRERTYSNVYNTTYPQTDTSVSNVMFSADELFSRLARLYAEIVRTRVPLVRRQSRVVVRAAATA